MGRICFRPVARLPASLWPPLEKIQGFDWEVIRIDDGSTDSTLTELIALARSDRRFRILELSCHFGKEMALSAGLDAARRRRDPVDADLQDPPELEGEMLAAWQADAKAVLAHRIDRWLVLPAPAPPR